MKFPVTPRIKEELTKAGIRHPWANISVHDDSYVYLRELIDNGGYGHLSDEERHAITVGCCYTHPDHKEKHLEPLIHPIKKASARYATQLNESLEWNVFSMIAFRGIVIILLGLILVAQAHCQMASSAGPSSSAPSPMQTSQIDVITFRTSTGTVVRSYASPFNIKEGTGVTFSATPSTLTINAAGGAGGYATIQNVGVAITQRAIINLLAAFTCVDNAGTVSSDCKLAANAAVANQYLTGVDASGNLLRKQIAYGELSGVPSTFASTPHPLLDSSVDSDTAVGTVARGDLITGQSISPKWTRLAKGTANQILAMDGTGTDIVWTIPLVKAQQVVSTVYTDQNNTYSASTVQDMDTARAKYWGSAPVFDASEYAGTDMCDKIFAVYSDAAFIAAPTAVIDARGFTGSQNCATSNLFNTTHSTKWIFNPGLHVHLTQMVFTPAGVASNNVIAVPSAPALATATTGGSLAAATTYGVKVTLLNMSGETTASAEATKLTGAGATNTITVTPPTATFGSACYNVYSATPVGSGWKLNNTSGCIPLGLAYVIKTVGAGVVPPVANLAATDQYEIDFGGSTWSLEGGTGQLTAWANNTYFHDLNLIALAGANHAIETNSNVRNIWYDNIHISGGATGIAVNNGDKDIRISRVVWGNPTATTPIGIWVNGGTNVRIQDFEALPGVWPAAGFYAAGIMLNPCTDCTIERTICTSIDATLNQFDSCVAVIGNNSSTTGSTNVNVNDTMCDGLIQVNCIDVNGFATNVNINGVVVRNTNATTGISGTTTPQADGIDIFMAARVNVSNVLCRGLSPNTNLAPCIEIYESSEVSITNAQLTDSSGGIAIFGSPSTHLTNITASRNWGTGINISDHTAQVTCNTTTAVVWVSGNPFGPWMQGTNITIAGTPFQVASVTDSQHMTLLTACSAGANQAQIVPTLDISLINPKLDDNGKNGTGAARTAPGQEGLYASGSTQITIIGGSANDNQPTASKSQQYGIRFENSARGRVIGTDTTNNVGGASCLLEYGANVAGNHGICDSPKKSAVLIDDNVSGKWTLAAASTAGASLRLPVGVDPTTPVTGDFWNDGTTIQYLSSNNALIQNLPQKIWLTGNYTNATTTFSTVASGNTLAFPVAASQAYHVQCDILYSGSASTAGLKIQFTGPASPTAVWYSLSAFTGATAVSEANTIVGFSNSIAAATTPATALLPATIHLWLRNGANAGTVTLQAASVGTGTVTINNASGCTMW